jgi:hypothetical protein
MIKPHLLVRVRQFLNKKKMALASLSFVHWVSNLSIKRILLLDFLGATTTCLLLTAVVGPYQAYFGMPISAINILVKLGMGFALYSFVCSVISKQNSFKLLIPIMIGNMAYVSLTLFYLAAYSAEITELGLLYFLGESLIVCILVYVEWLVIKKLLKKDVKPF